MYPCIVYSNPKNVINGRKKENHALKAAFKNQLTPPQNAVFFLDHILEEILSHVDRSTLISCRLVSRRGSYFASKELQKIVQLKFGIKKSSSKCCFKIIKNLENDPNFNPNRTFKKLTSLMYKSPKFPCNSFLFHNPDAIYTQGKKFFSQNGIHIKKLELTGGDLDIPVYFEDLKDILLVKSANLEILILNCRVVSMYQTSLAAILKILPPRLSLYDTHLNNSASHVRLNLKILEFKRKVPEQLFHELLDSSPKLVKVSVEENEDLHLLVMPVNRLFLLKSLKLVISSLPEILESQEIFAHALSESSNWAVKNLYFDGEYLRHMEHSLRPWAIENVSKILNCVANSVRQVKWGDVECLGAAFQFPQMPRVKELVLSLHVYNSFSDPRLRTQRFFPKYLSLEKIFPNLKTVRLVCVPENLDVPVSFSRCRRVESVTRLIIYGTAQGVYFQDLFPNAIVSYEKFDGVDISFCHN